MHSYCHIMPVRGKIIFVYSLTLVVVCCRMSFAYSIANSIKSVILTQASANKQIGSSGSSVSIISSKKDLEDPSQNNNDKRGDDSDVINAIALIAGTTVGAGILALPSISKETGFLYSSLGLVGSYIFMLVTGLFIAEVNCNLMASKDRQQAARGEAESIGVLSMATQTLGNGVGTASGLIYVFMHYALLVAYISQGGKILSEALSLSPLAGMSAFTAAIGGTLAFAPKEVVARMNNAFVVVVLSSFLLLVVCGTQSITNLSSLFEKNDLAALWSIIPVMLVALVYHNVVPSVSAQLKYNKKKITKAITIGSLIPLGMFVLWNFVILGIGASQNGADIESIPQSSTIMPTAISVFSESAIITSFIGFVIGLLSFFNDLFASSKADKSEQKQQYLSAEAKSKLIYALTLMPPFILALLNPDIFLQALDVSGTYGISILFGALPAAMVMKLRGDNKGNERYETFVGGGAAVPVLVLFLTAAVIFTH